ncbi:MAG: hypothetical protein H0T48_08565 [Gemmatimonadaceae bacterium]|nr:hypothetical protein [Gemmatimonadaceae bacterium]
MRLRALSAASLLIAGGCSEPAAPPMAVSSNATPTNVATATAGLAVATTPTFVVNDANGNAIGGVPVAITVSAGGGTLTNAATSTSKGPTPVGTWTLGRTVGINSLTITVASLSPVVITIIGVPGLPASIAAVRGANQVAAAGTNLPEPVVFQVRDQFANGVPGVSVAFNVVGGGGSIAPGPVTTDASGNAASSPWRLGQTAVDQALAATGGGFTATAPAIVASDFDVEVRVFGTPMPQAAAEAFFLAAARIRASVTGDVANVSIATPVNIEACGVPGVTVSETVDDVVIYASVTPIDGAGRVLASAGPCLTRSPAGGSFTVIGVMRFDTDDIDGLIATGRLKDVVQHEMLHVVGVGTLWSRKNLIAGATTAESRFIGALGLAACLSLGGAPVCDASVPVENTGGAGTADGHWRESVFDNELMTGFVEAAGFSNPMSTITIQSLADVGYGVNVFAADAYQIPGFSALGTRSQIVAGVAEASWEQVLMPRFEVSTGGVVRALRLQ